MFDDVHYFVRSDERRRRSRWDVLQKPLSDVQDFGVVCWGGELLIDGEGRGERRTKSFSFFEVCDGRGISVSGDCRDGLEFVDESFIELVEGSVFRVKLGEEGVPGVVVMFGQQFFYGAL